MSHKKRRATRHAIALGLDPKRDRPAGEGIQPGEGRPFLLPARTRILPRCGGCDKITFSNRDENGTPWCRTCHEARLPPPSEATA